MKESDTLRQTANKLLSDIRHSANVGRVIIGGSLIISILIVVIYVTIQPPGLNTSIPDRSQIELDQGGLHVGPGTPHSPYRSNPPTSGPMYEQPAKWGVYFSVLPDETVVHNLEHGGIWLSYRDPADAEAAVQLQSIAEKYPTIVILSNRPANDSRVAVAAWGRVLKLDSVDSSQIYNFIARYRLRGPENGHKNPN